MVERIYDTLKGILYNDLPKNAKDQVVVYDRPWNCLHQKLKLKNIS